MQIQVLEPTTCIVEIVWIDVNHKCQLITVFLECKHHSNNNKTGAVTDCDEFTPVVTGNKETLNKHKDDLKTVEVV